MERGGGDKCEEVEAGPEERLEPSDERQVDECDHDCHEQLYGRAREEDREREEADKELLFHNHEELPEVEAFPVLGVQERERHAQLRWRTIDGLAATDEGHCESCGQKNGIWQAGRDPPSSRLSSTRRVGSIRIAEIGVESSEPVKESCMHASMRVCTTGHLSQAWTGYHSDWKLLFYSQREIASHAAALVSS